jgi:hypothetical protein
MGVTSFFRLFLSSQARNASQASNDVAGVACRVGNPVLRLPGLPLAKGHKLITHRYARQKLGYTRSYPQPRASR